MSIITPNEGERNILGRALGKVAANTLVCRLFNSNTTPSATTVWADLTECDFSGYASVNITWTAIVTNGSGRAESTGSVCTFIRDGTDPGTNNTAYGWCITSINDAEANAIQIIAIERFGSSEDFSTFFKQLIITPKMNEFSEF